MSATRPARGRPRRTEAVKRLNFVNRHFYCGIKGRSLWDSRESATASSQRFCCTGPWGELEVKLMKMNHLVQLALRDKVSNARILNIFNGLSWSILIQIFDQNFYIVYWRCHISGSRRSSCSRDLYWHVTCALIHRQKAVISSVNADTSSAKK